ncbi:hypothetical protein N865_16350 [Intrasporangium oryzae NRRL B-24470]|uniref:Uncharacterized protein n=1 Tax=Intrasporangium oryzae NRRL B-24470 TaxID=1386089 RepID=W9G4T0_9MICO|nr:hypothetical protein [Intrasporangium oryzae]EWT00322.1 hypothetical protein N865_16350 [Intrasporangium oryzae NRRL B-24470]
MNNTTMMTNAAACVVSVRPRPVSHLLVADRADRQGTTVSIAAYRGAALSGFGAPAQGDTSVVVTTLKTFDVARSRLGRPPV